MRVLFSSTRQRRRTTPFSNLATVSALGQAAPITMSETVETGTFDLRGMSLGGALYVDFQLAGELLHRHVCRVADAAVVGPRAV